MQTNKPILLVVSLFVLLWAADAQKKGKGKRTATKKSTTVKTKTAVQNNNAAQMKTPKYNYDSLPVPPPRVSKEIDRITLEGPVNPATVLTYEPVSEDDIMYRQRVWRDIDVREKINQPFAYTSEGDKGPEQFIYVLLNAIQNDPRVIAYSSLDDRFATPMTKPELTKLLVGEGRWERIPNWAIDSTGRTFKDTFIIDDFNPALITRYRLKEDWVFNKKTSRLMVRILGIAPIQEDSVPGGVIEKPLFWLYYPKLRNTLANYEVYNAKNHGARPTWEQIFESRMFNSYIVKSTMDNPRDLYLRDMPGLKNNKLIQQWEGEHIRNKIFDYEQNLWSY